MTNYDTRKIKIGGPKFICTYIGIACKSVYIATYSIIKKALCHCKLFNLCMAENVHSAVADVTLEL